MTANKERLCEIILAPLLTEKSYSAAQGERKQIFFKVQLEATKAEIKEAIKFLFDVDVEAVNTSRVKGKTRFFKQMRGRNQDWKKAMVTLKAGQDISFLTEN